MFSRSPPSTFPLVFPLFFPLVSVGFPCFGGVSLAFFNLFSGSSRSAGHGLDLAPRALRGSPFTLLACGEGAPRERAPLSKPNFYQRGVGLLGETLRRCIFWFPPLVSLSFPLSPPCFSLGVCLSFPCFSICLSRSLSFLHSDTPAYLVHAET